WDSDRLSAARSLTDSERRTLRGLFTDQSKELQANDGRDGCGECFDGSAVVGVEDTPGFDVGDGSLDHVPNLVDLSVEFLLPVQKLTASRFLDRRDHVVTDVALIADPVSRVKGGEHVRFTQAIGVMPTAVDGIGNPGQASGKGTGDLNIQAGGLVLTGVQL